MWADWVVSTQQTTTQTMGLWFQNDELTQMLSTGVPRPLGREV